MENIELLKKKANDTAQEWLDGNYDTETKDQIRYLMANDPAELFESFYTWMDFGTAGLRGIMGVGSNRMNRYTVGLATQGLANCLLASFDINKQTIRVAIAYDCRNNGEFFTKTAAKVLIANGIKVSIFESLRPTPELSFAVRHLGCQAGIVVTASHNPKQYNGYKVYWDDGGQIIAPHDKNLMTAVAAIKSIDEVKLDGDETQIEYLGEEFDNIYLDRVKTLSVMPEVIQRNHDMPIVYTPIHGTGVKLVPESLKRFGFTNIIHVPEQDVTDGNFPTVISPNPEERAAMDMALAKARQTNAELVLATDPDADRVGAAVKDDTGELILLNGNQTGSLLIYYMLRAWKDKGKLTGNEFIVKTIVTTELQADIAKKFNVEYFDVLTGFKYIGGLIKQFERQKQFIVGGEESYGYLVGDFVRDKDAVSSAALIAEVAAWAKDNGKSLFDLLLDIYVEFGFYKESMQYIVKEGKAGAEEINRIMHEFRNNPPKTINQSQVVAIKDYLTLNDTNCLTGAVEPILLPKSDVLQFFLADGSKISVRPSGTEPKIKFYISVKQELKNKESYREVEKALDQQISLINADLGIGK